MRQTLLALLLAGCGPGAADLVVELKTDLSAPDEFSAVRVTVARAGDEANPIAEEVTPTFELGGDLLEGVRVAEEMDLEPGPLRVTVELRDAVGTVILARRVAVELREDLVITVLLTRSCVGVTCPGAGDDPALTECLGGRCVPPECSGTEPDCGEPECEADADCVSGPACVVGACDEGACLYAPDDAACADAERCDIVIGCTGGCPASCDDGDPCTDDACDGARCQHTPNTEVCDDGVFCNGPDTCAAGACTDHAGDPCSGSTVCDETEGTCVGCATDTDCPDPMPGPWSACAGFDGTCDETGTRARTVTSFTCVDTVCTPADAMESEACSRVRDGMSCGPGGAVCAEGACECPGGPTESACGNGVDDDCDGDLDCADADCNGDECDLMGRVCSASVCVCPGGTTESVCDDGLDLDCDGDVDCADADCDGMTCAAGGRVCAGGACECPVTAPTLVGTLAAASPRIVWTGTEFGVMYSTSDYWFARVDATGTVLASDLPITTTASIAHPAHFAFNGSEYGVAWSDTRSGSNDVYFRRFSTLGALVGPEEIVSASPTELEAFASIAWDGTRFGVVWSEGPGADLDMRFRPYGPGGGPLGPEVTAVNSAGFLDWTESIGAGANVATGYHEATAGTLHAWLAVLDPTGIDPDGPDMIDDGGAAAALVDLAWTGTEIGIVWRDSRHGNEEIYFATATAGGVVGANVRVTNAAGGSTTPRIAWNGAEYGVVWADDRSGTQQIYFRRLSPTGTPLGTEEVLSCAIVTAGAPDIAWNGTRWGVVWSNHDGGSSRLAFRSLVATVGS